MIEDKEGQLGSTVYTEYVDPGVKQYKRCFVGYLDILGFKNKCLKSDYPELLDYYLRILFKNIKTCCGMNKIRTFDSLPVKFAWVSDSILLYTDGNSADDFRIISNIIAGFMMGNLKKGPFPIRGALSEGDFYCDSKRSIYFGKAMIEAIACEKKQNWAGVTLTPSCVSCAKLKGNLSGIRKISIDRGINSPLLEISGPLLIEYEVPVKGEASGKRYVCINWTVACTIKNREELRKVFLSLGESIVDPSVEEKNR